RGHDAHLRLRDGADLGHGRRGRTRRRTLLFPQSRRHAPPRRRHLPKMHPHVPVVQVRAGRLLRPAPGHHRVPPAGASRAQVLRPQNPHRHGHSQPARGCKTPLAHPSSPPPPPPLPPPPPRNQNTHGRNPTRQNGRRLPPAHATRPHRHQAG